MRRFLVQVGIDSLVIIVTFALLSRIQIAQPFPFGTGSAPIVTVQWSEWALVQLVITGASLTVLYAVLRPLLVILTGRLLLWSLGTFQIVVIAIVLAIAAWVSPIVTQLADPTWVWILVAAAIVGGLRVLLGALLGLARPPNESDFGRRIWRYLDALPTPRRSVFIENLRLQQVYDTLYGYGIEIVLEDSPIAPIRAWGQRFLLGEKNPTARMSTPAKVRTMLQELGPTYVKLGQIVASRGDALPPEWAIELSKLQSEVRPVAYKAARQVVVDDLGKPPDELFATFDENPIAAASTAQIHRATLPDGTIVAVKIQRPFIVALTKADLGVIQEIARFGSSRLEIARKLDLEGIVREFASGVIAELDYGNEAYNARRLSSVLTKFPDVHIPATFPEFSSTRVLTQEFVSGIKISNTTALAEAGVDLQRIGDLFVRSLIRQILIEGFFHGDPHPGNVLVDPATDRLIFIDLGMVGQLTSQQRINLVDLIFSVTNRDYEGVASTMLALSKRAPNFDESAYRSAMDKTLRRFLEYDTGASLSTGLNAIMSVVYDSGLRLNNQLTIALKALIQSDETARALSPTVDIAQAAIAESRDEMLERLSQENVEAEVKKQALRVGRQLLQRLPTLENALWSWMDEFGKGQLTIKVDTSDLGEQFGTLNAIGGMLTIGMILAGALVGLAIVTVMLLQPAVGDALGPVPAIAALIFIALLGYALRQVRRFSRSISPHRDDR
jgi:ubiquinone biosynthesis protein